MTDSSEIPAADPANAPADSTEPADPGLPPGPTEDPEPTPPPATPDPVTPGTIAWEPQTWYSITYACRTVGCVNENHVYGAPMFYSNDGLIKNIRVVDGVCGVDSAILTATKLDPQPIPE